MNTRNFFAELKRRNVYKVAVAYAVVSWLLIQIATQVSPFFEVPNWAIRLVVLVLVLGFPVALVLSWAFEITPEGIRLESEVGPDDPRTRRTGRKLIGITTAVAVAAGGMLAFQLLRPRLMTEPTPAASQTTPVAVISEQSIAVLPFVDMSQDKDQGYFSDGIAEELLNLLGRIPQLKVPSRTSSFSFKGKQVEIPEIARQLHVANVLDGSVRKSGDQLRITVQLTRADGGYYLWSETYDRKMDDIFKIQDEIAGEVVKKLKISLLGAVPKVRTTDPQAYALYLQARELARKFTPDAFAKSDALFRQVLEIDPRYVPAWNELAVNFNGKVGMGLISGQEGNARAREAAEKALAIDPEYAPAHATLGLSAMQSDNDLAGAARHLQRALELDPTNIAVLSGAANLLSTLGRLDDALALQEAVVRLDPVSVYALSNLGASQCVIGRYDEAIASYRAVLRLSPGRGGAHAQLGMVFLQKGDASAALAEIEPLERFVGPAAERVDVGDVVRPVLFVFRDQRVARGISICGASERTVGHRQADHPPRLVLFLLDKAVAYQDVGLNEIVAQKLFDPIHSDPRWLPFLRKIGKAPDQLAKIEFKMPPLQ